MRAHIDVSEIEEQTKIRARYLRALENEEWGLLPGPAYTKSFLRAYAQALGLDGRALVEEYKAAYENNNDGERPEHARQAATYSRRRRAPVGRPRFSRGYLIAVLTVCIVIVLALVGLLTRSSSNRTASRGSPHTGAHARRHAPSAPTPTSGSVNAGSSTPSNGSAVTVSLRPTGRIWVCMVDQGGRKLIPGSILLPEVAKAQTFRGTRFELDLGNNDLELLVNGRRQRVPASTEPIGYSITTAGVTPLAPGHLPTCA